MAKALIVEIFGDAKQFAAELDKAAGKTRQMSAVAGVAGVALAAGLAVGLDKSVKAALAGQVAQEALNTALTNTHQSVAAMSPALEEAEAASRKLGFTDDESRVALAKLETATGDTGKSIKDLALAEDIARLKHVGLDVATKLLTGTLGGSSRAAKQLGIDIIPVTSHMDALIRSTEDLTTSQGRADAAQARFLDKQATGARTLQEVTDRVHGQAAAFADTAAGGMEQFHAQTQHLEESLGNLLLPALTAVAGAMAAFSGFLGDHTHIAAAAVAVVGVLATTLIAVSVATKLATAATVLANVAVKAWTAAQWLLNAALDANPIGLVILAIAGLVAGLILAYQHSETFRRIVTGAFDAVRDAANFVLHFFESNWKLITLLISGPFLPIVAVATNAFGIRSALIGAFDAILAGARTAWNSVVAVIKGAVEIAKGVVGDLIGTFEGIISVLERIIGAAESAASAIAKVAGAAGGVAGAVGGVLGHIPGFASGVTNFAGGLAVVGENGPELVTLPAGSNVIPNGNFAGGGGGSTVVNVTVNGWVGNDQQLASRLRQELIKIGRANVSVGLA